MPVVDDDICTGCAERWEKRSLPGKRLVTLKRRTINKSLEVVVCPYCDGEPVVKIAAANDKV